MRLTYHFCYDVEQDVKVELLSCHGSLDYCPRTTLNVRLFLFIELRFNSDFSMNHIYKLLWCFMLSMKSFRFEVRDNLIVCDGISSNLDLFTPSSRFIFCAKHPRALISPFRVWVVMEALNCGYKERQMFAVKTPSQILQPSIRSLIFQSQFAGKKQQQEEIKKKHFDRFI